VLWAIERHAKEGSYILTQIKPPGNSPSVYRSIHAGKICAVSAPGKPPSQSGPSLEEGQCFYSKERRLSERSEMWVSMDVEEEGGQWNKYWVAESSGGVSLSVVEIEEVERLSAAEVDSIVNSAVEDQVKTTPEVVGPSPSNSNGEGRHTPAYHHPHPPPKPFPPYDDVLAEVFTPERRPRVSSASQRILRDLDNFAEEQERAGSPASVREATRKAIREERRRRVRRETASSTIPLEQEGGVSSEELRGWTWWIHTLTQLWEAIVSILCPALLRRYQEEPRSGYGSRNSSRPGSRLADPREEEDEEEGIPLVKEEAEEVKSAPWRGRRGYEVVHT